MKYLITLLLLLPLVSCMRKCDEKMSGIRQFTFPFYSYGYTRDEIDTVIVKWFQPGGNLSQQIEQRTFSLVYDGYDLGFYGHIDTIDRVEPFDSFLLSHYYVLKEVPEAAVGYDAEITIPAQNRIYKITDITMDGPHERVVEYDCSTKDGRPLGFETKIISYKIDGVIVYSDKLTLVK